MAPTKKSSEPTQEPADSEQPHASTQTEQGTKRKKAATTNSNEPNKAPRRSARGVTSKSRPSHQQLLTFLLSSEAESLCRPHDETEFIDNHRHDNTKTYSSGPPFTPFEELLSAVILSRPISHRLGLRSIRTVLNSPYNFNGAKAISDAGSEKVEKAFWDARTQHKGKTAGEVSGLAEVARERFCSGEDVEGTELEKVRELGKGDVEREREVLKGAVKGLGATGLDIFCRRVQWVWEEVYPFVDERTKGALEKLGLPGREMDLVDVIEGCWGDLETGELEGKDDKAKKRRAFVVILERAIGADLEKKVGEVVQAAAA